MIQTKHPTINFDGLNIYLHERLLSQKCGDTTLDLYILKLWKHLFKYF